MGSKPRAGRLVGDTRANSYGNQQYRESRAVFQVPEFPAQSYNPLDFIGFDA
jgi:hypothetical protein